MLNRLDIPRVTLALTRVLASSKVRLRVVFFAQVITQHRAILLHRLCGAYEAKDVDLQLRPRLSAHRKVPGECDRYQSWRWRPPSAKDPWQVFSAGSPALVIKASKSSLCFWERRWLTIFFLFLAVRLFRILTTRLIKLSISSFRCLPSLGICVASDTQCFGMRCFCRLCSFGGLRLRPLLGTLFENILQAARLRGPCLSCERDLQYGISTKYYYCSWPQRHTQRNHVW